VGSVRREVEPAQMFNTPEIGAGTGFTINVAVVRQPVIKE
jgi:hypothetical protein